MTIAQDLEPVAAPATPVSTGDAGTPPSPQPQGVVHSEHPAPAAPAVAPVPGSAPEDYRAKHDRLVNESIPRLQSQAATEKNRADGLERELATLREEVGDVEELRYEIANERDTAWADQIGKWVAEGATLKQVHEQVRRQMTDVTAQRTQSEAHKANVEGLIGIVEGYDKPYATFLRQMAKHGTAITQESITGLRSTYDAFKGAGTPAQAAAAATNSETPPKEPPVVPQGGSPARIGDAPAYQPGDTGRSLIKRALAGHFGTTFERPARRE